VVEVVGGSYGLGSILQMRAEDCGAEAGISGVHAAVTRSCPTRSS
jgi:hypothetical protein